MVVGNGLRKIHYLVNSMRKEKIDESIKQNAEDSMVERRDLDAKSNILTFEMATNYW